MKRRTQNKRINAFLKTQPEHGEVKLMVLDLEASIAQLRRKNLTPPKDMVFLTDKLNQYVVKTRISIHEHN